MSPSGETTAAKPDASSEVARVARPNASPTGTLAALENLISGSRPGARIDSVRPFGVDEGEQGAAGVKAIGYGQPLRIELQLPSGEHEVVVFHTATANDFGHDRRADRAAEMLLAFDSFNDIPAHTRAIDVGAIDTDGRLISLRSSGEFFLLSSFVEGHVYADDLRRVAKQKRASAHDCERASRLGRYLAKLHRATTDRPQTYARSIRDLVGSGEGIFGIIDGYPEGVVAAGAERLQAIEQRCVSWRWRLQGECHRLCRIHGDFHPFNIVFDDSDELGLLDASRGCAGDAADDLSALSVNYLFFALQAPGSWATGFALLWRAFFEAYFQERPDPQLLEVAPPFFTWRSLVVANPRWYPDIAPSVRDRLLGYAEDCLDAGKLDLEAAGALFA